jgi:tetraacyldisaccharide 4'-kinase
MIKLTYPKFWNKRNLLSFLMIPFSYIYLFLGFVRNKISSKIILSQKVICIGNITLGGAGKTQIVAWLARLLKQKKISFVIITKAYKSNLKKVKLVEMTDSAKEVGDESIMLRNYGCVIAAKKIQYALPLINQINPKIVILDDGMQNPCIKKDLQICAIDTLNLLGNNMIFPSGPLRENLSSGLMKSDMIFMIGNNKCKDSNLIKNIKLSQKPCFKATIKLREELDRDIEYIAFTGIANPEKFYFLLSQNHFKLKQCISFGDHHDYSNNDVKKLVDLAISNDCYLITTEKDYVKLDSNYQNLIICAKVNLNFENEQECMDLIYEKLF